MRRLATLATATVLFSLVSPGVQAQAQPQPQGASITAESRIAKNWRARIIFKSGATQDLLWVGVSTDTFNQMRMAFWRYLNNEGPNRFNSTGPDGVQIAITWADVSAVTTWTD